MKPAPSPITKPVRSASNGPRGSSVPGTMASVREKAPKIIRVSSPSPPPAITTFARPARIMCTAWIRASEPEAQAPETVRDGARDGRRMLNSAAAALGMIIGTVSGLTRR